MIEVEHSDEEKHCTLHTEGHCRYANREKGREAHNQQISPLNEEKRRGLHITNKWMGN